MIRGCVVLVCIVAAVVAAAPAWGGDTLDLTEGWRFAPDPDKTGAEQGWQGLELDDSSWAVIRAGERWEDQGFLTLDGVAWYRKRVEVPESMRAARIWLMLGGINDSGTVYCNGTEVRRFGDEESISVARTPIVADLTPHIRWGQENLIAVRVFDWGNSGGLALAPCALTTDPEALSFRSLFNFVPGFEGRASVVGVETAPFGTGPEDRIRFSAAVNDAEPVVKDAALVPDREGRMFAVASFDLAPHPGDRVRLSAEIAGSAAEPDAPYVLEKTYTWPEPPRWPGKYSGLRVLNNFVTELHSAPSVSEWNPRHAFLNPREGWVFIRVRGNDKAVARLDDESAPLVWRKHPETGDLEAMRYLSEGEHTLRLEQADGARLDIRAVPEIAFCYWPTRTVLGGLPPRDAAFAERYIFPNMNTLLTHNDMTEEEFASWRAEGRQWINNSSLPGLHDETPPTADAVYEDWAGNACVTRPGYAGIIVDEFLNNSTAHYDAWTSAVERLHEHPGFQGQTFYAWVVDTFQHKPGLAFMRRLYDLGGRFAWERYLREEPSEEMAVLRMYEELGALEEWGELMPGLKERLLYCLGSFSLPWCSLNINPSTNFLPYVDRQFQTLATDPLFFGSRGIFQWAAHYTDDDALRYSLALYRHYCIEGKRTPFRDFPFRLTHIENPDFDDGLQGWRVEPAGAESIAAGSYRGLGLIEGRWTNIGIGDRCAVVVRAENAANRIGQTIKNLEPGRLYSLKFFAADLDHLDRKEEVGLWPTIERAKIVEEGSFRLVVPSSYAIELEDFSRERPAYSTYVQVMFRPDDTTAELAFCDWKDGKPAGPAGQRIAFNFVEIQPYFE
jgi:hypothetical protein